MYLIDDKKNAELMALAMEILKTKFAISVDHLSVVQLKGLLDLMAECLNKNDTKFYIVPHIVTAVYGVDIVSRTDTERQSIINLISFILGGKENK